MVHSLQVGDQETGRPETDNGDHYSWTTNPHSRHSISYSSTNDLNVTELDGEVPKITELETIGASFPMNKATKPDGVRDMILKRIIAKKPDLILGTLNMNGFKKRDTPVCHDCLAPSDNPEHAFFICDRWWRLRREL